jgi:hypothetical protein
VYSKQSLEGKSWIINMKCCASCKLQAERSAINNHAVEETFLPVKVNFFCFAHLDTKSV